MLRAALAGLVAAVIGGCAGAPTDAGTLPGSPSLPDKLGEWTAAKREGNSAHYVRGKEEEPVVVTLRVFHTSTEANEDVHARLKQVNASFTLHEGDVEDLGRYYAFRDSHGYRGGVYRRKNAVVHVSFPSTTKLPDPTCEAFLRNLVLSTAPWGD